MSARALGWYWVRNAPSAPWQPDQWLDSGAGPYWEYLDGGEWAEIGPPCVMVEPKWITDEMGDRQLTIAGLAVATVWERRWDNPRKWGLIIRAASGIVTQDYPTEAAARAAAEAEVWARLRASQSTRGMKACCKITRRWRQR
jgi:hypothetical protein